VILNYALSACLWSIQLNFRMFKQRILMHFLWHFTERWF
jgi:hypothetical protein